MKNIDEITEMDQRERFQITTSTTFFDNRAILTYHVIDTKYPKETKVFTTFNATQAIKRKLDLNNVDN